MSALLFFGALPVSAVNNDTIAPLAKDLGTPVTSIKGGVELLITAVKWLYTIFFIVAVLFVILAAYNFVFSKGDKEKVKAARQQIIWAVMAIVVALVSMLSVALVRDFLINA